MNEKKCVKLISDFTIVMDYRFRLIKIGVYSVKSINLTDHINIF